VQIALSLHTYSVQMKFYDLAKLAMRWHGKTPPWFWHFSTCLWVGGPSKVYEAYRSQVQGAIDALVRRAIKSGDIRRDLDPFDLLRALIGVSNVASSPDWKQSARRLVDILITGSRPSK